MNAPHWWVNDPAQGDIPTQSYEDDILDVHYGNVTITGERRVLREHGLLDFYEQCPVIHL